MWSRLISTWRNLTERARVERELDDELRAYVELLTAEKVRHGVPPERAKREALMEAGGMEQVKEEVRDASAGRLLNELGQDVRHSLRSLGRNAASSTLAIATLMLGIGAATVIFSVFYTVLLRPLPFANLDRLVEIHESRLDRNIDHSSVSMANFWDLRAQRRTFDEIAAYTGGDANMTGNGAPEHVTLGVISAGWWRVLGVQPLLGRDFVYEEDRPGAPNVALLRHRFWKQRFQGDPAIVGQTIRLNDKAYLVVGVMPPGEPWLNSNDVFVPMVYSPQADRGSWELEVVGRMSRGVTIESARADLQNTAASLARQYPQDDKGMGVAIGPATEWVASKELRRALWVLLGAVGLLLLIACVNVANLLLARSTQRSREIAIRRALGAGRFRIIRLLLTESLMLSAAGAALGVAIAEAAAIALRATQIDAIPRLSELSLNGWVLAGTLTVAVLTGLL
ncbi:MAG: ABC transporter permease, partial [Bryobacteraceae bacterium]